MPTKAALTTCPTLLTERLLLRPWCEADKIPFAALNAHPEVMAHFPAPLTPAESNALATRIMTRIAHQGWGFWALERRTQPGFLGFVGLNCPEGLPFSPCTEIGWRLARPHWGHGYATEAARACLHFAFHTLCLPKVVAFTAQTNQRSQAVMGRLGMTFEQNFKHPALPEGHRLQAHVLFVR